jgi:hypothetical protein
MFFALHAEKWLSGSTRTELSPDERACFIDILARATLIGADEPGEIRFVNEEQLAIEVRNTHELLLRTLEKCKRFKKIRIHEDRKEKIHVLRILNWKKYQHVYMHQKAYRQRQKALRERQEAGTNNDNRKITGDNRRIAGYGDRIGEDKDYEKDKRRDRDNLSNNPSKRNFLALLEELSKDPKTPYPFNPVLDGALYDQARTSCPNANLQAEVEKKFIHWKSDKPEYPMVPERARRQLLAWLKKEEEFQEKEHGWSSSSDGNSKPGEGRHLGQKS